MLQRRLIARTGDGGRYVYIFNIDERVCTAVLPVPGNKAALDFSPDGALLAVGGSGLPYVFVYDVAGTVMLHGASPGGAANGVAFSPSGDVLAIAHNGSPFLTVRSTDEWVDVPVPALAGNGNACAFSPDGAFLAVAHSTSPFLTIYNTSDWTKVPGVQVAPGNGLGCAFSPDGTKLLLGHGTAPYASVYDTSTWTRSNIPGVPSQTWSVAFYPDGSRVVLGTNNALIVKNAADWSTIPTGIPSRGTYYGCAVSPDGKILATAHSLNPFYSSFDADTYAPLTEAINDQEAMLLAESAGRAVAFHYPQPRILRGVVRDKDGMVAARDVRAYRRGGGMLAGETTSSATTGEYELKLYGSDTEEFDVQFMAGSDEQLNDLFFARATTSEE